MGLERLWAYIRVPSAVVDGGEKVETDTPGNREDAGGGAALLRWLIGVHTRWRVGSDAAGDVPNCTGAGGWQVLGGDRTFTRSRREAGM